MTRIFSGEKKRPPTKRAGMIFYLYVSRPLLAVSIY